MLNVGTETLQCFSCQSCTEKNGSKVEQFFWYLEQHPEVGWTSLQFRNRAVCWDDTLTCTWSMHVEDQDKQSDLTATTPARITTPAKMTSPVSLTKSTDRPRCHRKPRQLYMFLKTASGNYQSDIQIVETLWTWGRGCRHIGVSS